MEFFDYLELTYGNNKVTPSVYKKELELNTLERYERSLMCEKPLKNFIVKPSVLIFQNYQNVPNLTLPLTIMNSSRRQRPLDLKFKISKYFKLVANELDISTHVLAGSSVSFKVQFNPGNVNDLCEEIQFTSINDRFSVPIIAIGNRAIIDFPDLVRLKDSALNRKTAQKVTMTNIGTKTADIRMKVNKRLKISPQLQIEPSAFKLGPSESQEIQIEFESKIVGKCVIMCNIEILDVANLCFQVVTNTRDLTKLACFDVDRLVFDEIYLGNKTEKMMKIFNKGCSELQFKWKNIEKSNVFQINPMFGEITANSFQECTITFQPNKVAEFEDELNCEITDEEIGLSLKVKGAANGPKFESEPSHLKIEKVLANSKKNIEIQFRNTGEIPGTIEFCPFLTNELKNIFDMFKYHPERVEIVPTDVAVFKFIFLIRKCGAFFEELNFRCVESNVMYKVVFEGNVVEPNVLAELPNEINFGEIGFGFPVFREIQVSNKTEVKIPFNVQILSSNKETAISWQQYCTNKSLTDINNTTEMNFEPMNMVIQPYSTLTGTLKVISNSIGVTKSGLIFATGYSNRNTKLVHVIYETKLPEIICEPREFVIQPCYVCEIYKKSILIKNVSHVQGFFRLKTSEDSEFEVQFNKEDGILNPNDKIEVEVSIKLKILGTYRTFIFMNLFGGKASEICSILCHGEGPTIVAIPEQLIFDTIPLLEQVTKTVVLRNDSEMKAIIQAEIDNECLWNVKLDSTEIKPHDTTKMIVSVILCNSGKYIDEIRLKILNGYDMRFRVVAIGTGYSFVIEPDIFPAFNFGWVFTNRLCSRKLKFINKGLRDYRLMFSKDPNKTIDHGNVKLIAKFDPNPIVLKALEETEVTIEINQSKTGSYEEMVFLHVNENQQKMPIVLGSQLLAQFIEPLVKFSKTDFEFILNLKSKSEFRILKDEFSIENLLETELNTKMQVQDPFYFITKQNPNERSNTKNICLKAKQLVNISIVFDASNYNDQKCYQFQKSLLISYNEHDCTTSLTLIGEINYPNIILENNFIDFGCILSNTECTKNILLKNISPLEVSYRWKWDTSSITLKDLQLQESLSCSDNVSDIGIISAESFYGYSTVVLESDSKVVDSFDCNDFMTLMPRMGTLKAGEQEMISISFHPKKSNISITIKAICDIEGGLEHYLALNGLVSDVSFTINDNICDFGRQVYNKMETKNLILENTGYLDFSYSFNTITNLSRYESIEFRPFSGTLKSKQVVKLGISYCPGLSGPIEKEIFLQIGQLEQPLLIVLKSYGTLPKIHFSLPEYLQWNNNEKNKFNYDIIARLDFSLIDITSIDKNIDSINADDWEIIESDANIPSVTFIDNKIKNDIFNCQIHEQVECIKISEYLVDFGYIEINTEKEYKFSILNNGESDLSLIIESESIEKLLKYGIRICFNTIDLKIGQNYSTTLLFSTNWSFVSNLENSFEIDFKINVLNIGYIKIVIKAVIVIPNLISSDNMLNFGNVESGECKMKSLILRNCGHVSLKWSYKYTKNDDEVFKIISNVNKMKMIKARDEIEVRILFQPKSENEMKCHLVIMIANNPKPVVVQLIGYGQSAKLLFESSVDFEPILYNSVNTSTTKEISIKNVGSLPAEFYFVQFLNDISYKDKVMEKILSDFKKESIFVSKTRQTDLESFEKLIEQYNEMLEIQAVSENKSIDVCEPIMPVELEPFFEPYNVNYNINNIHTVKFGVLLMFHGPPIMVDYIEFANKIARYHNIKIINFDRIVYELLLNNANSHLAVRLYGYLNSIYRNLKQTEEDIKLNNFDDFQVDVTFMAKKFTKSSKMQFMFNITEDLLTECLNGYLSVCENFLIFESLKSIFIPKPIDLMKLLLKCCSDFRYVHCFVLNTTYEEYKLRNKNLTRTMILNNNSNNQDDISVRILETESDLLSSVLIDCEINSRDDITICDDRSSSSSFPKSSITRLSKVQKRNQNRMKIKSEFNSFLKEVDEIYELYSNRIQNNEFQYWNLTIKYLEKLLSLPKIEFDKFFNYFPSEFNQAIDGRNKGISTNFLTIGQLEETFQKFDRDNIINVSNENCSNYFMIWSNCSEEKKEIDVKSNFENSCKKYRLNPNESLQLKIMFAPKQIGMYFLNVPIKCPKSFEKYSLKLNGVCETRKLSLELNSDLNKSRKELNYCVYLQKTNTFHFGNVIIGDDFIQKLYLRNSVHFSTICRLTLVSKSNTFILTKNEYSLEPAERKEIELHVRPLIDQTLTATLIIETEESPNTMEYQLEVVGRSFHFAIDEKLLIFEKNLKYFKRHQILTLRNSSECPVGFYFENLTALDTYFKVYPNIGTITADSIQIVNVKFLRSEIVEKFSKILTLIVHVVDNVKKRLLKDDITLSVINSCKIKSEDLKPEMQFKYKVNINPTEVNFGKIAYEDEITKHLFLKNECDQELNFSIDLNGGQDIKVKIEKKLRNKQPEIFSVNKSCGLIKPFDSVIVLVKCQGLKVGKFNKDIKVIIYENNQTQNVLLNAEIEEPSIDLTNYKRIFMRQTISQYYKTSLVTNASQCSFIIAENTLFFAATIINTKTSTEIFVENNGTVTATVQPMIVDKYGAFEILPRLITLNSSNLGMFTITFSPKKIQVFS